MKITESFITNRAVYRSASIARAQAFLLGNQIRNVSPISITAPRKSLLCEVDFYLLPGLVRGRLEFPALHGHYGALSKNRVPALHSHRFDRSIGGNNSLKLHAAVNVHPPGEDGIRGLSLY